MRPVTLALRGLCVTLAVLTSAQVARAQEPDRRSMESRLVGLGGSEFFVAPYGRLRASEALTVDAALRLGQGSSNLTEGVATLSYALPWNLAFQGGVTITSRTLGPEQATDRGVRLAISGYDLGLAVGVGRDRASAENYGLGTETVDVRAWMDVGVRLGITVRRSHVEEEGAVRRDTTHVILDRYVFKTPRESRFFRASEYSELELELGTDIVGNDVRLLAGHRFAGSADEPSVQWASVQIARPISSRVDAVAEFGRTPGHPGLGRGPSGFTRLGFKVGLFNSTAEVAEEPEMPATAAAPVSAEISAFEDAHGLVILAPGADKVEVKADFTDWSVRELEWLAPGRWGRPLEAGVYLLNIRVDGGPWTVPANVTVIPDDFTGSPVAVIIIP